MIESAYMNSKRNKNNLDSMLKFSSIMEANNIYIIDMMNGIDKNVSIEMTNATQKTIQLINLPEANDNILTITIMLKTTDVPNIVYFPGIIWRNNAPPLHLVGKTYFEAFISYDGGVTWNGFSAGAW